MRCKCGTQNPKEAKFCKSCGSPFRGKKPHRPGLLWYANDSRGMKAVRAASVAVPVLLGLLAVSRYPSTALLIVLGLLWVPRLDDLKTGLFSRTGRVWLSIIALTGFFGLLLSQELLTATGLILLAETAVLLLLLLQIRKARPR